MAAVKLERDSVSWEPPHIKDEPESPHIKEEPEEVPFHVITVKTEAETDEQAVELPSQHKMSRQRLVEHWAHKEVMTFLGIIGDTEIQRLLDTTTRNDKVYRKVAAAMSEAGYTRSAAQCRCKNKKMRATYKSIKDTNGQTGRDRKEWRYFALMDAIYGHKLSIAGPEGALDSAPALCPQEDALASGSSSSGELETDLAVAASLSSATATTLLMPPKQVPSDSVCSHPAPGHVSTSAPFSASTAAPSLPAATTPKVVTPSPAAARRLVFRKRKREYDQDAMLQVIQDSDAAFREDYRRGVQEIVQVSREHLQQDAEFNRDLLRQFSDFNATFLGLMSQLVQSSRSNNP